MFCYVCSDNGKEMKRLEDDSDNPRLEIYECTCGNVECCDKDELDVMML